MACRVSLGGNSWNYHIHLMRCAARQLDGERALERRGMAVSRRGIAISRRGMQKYTIFSWFCSCYLAALPVS